MNLPKEWEAIVLDVPNAMMIAREVVERCYALHTAPPRELTDSELVETYAAASFSIAGPLHTPERVKALRAVIAAHVAKQRAPQTVTFRAARRKDNGKVDLLPYNPEWPMYPCYSWLDADGKPQTFEVKI